MNHINHYAHQFGKVGIQNLPLHNLPLSKNIATLIVRNDEFSFAGSTLKPFSIKEVIDFANDTVFLKGNQETNTYALKEFFWINWIDELRFHNNPNFDEEWQELLKKLDQPNAINHQYILRCVDNSYFQQVEYKTLNYLPDGTDIIDMIFDEAHNDRILSLSSVNTDEVQGGYNDYILLSNPNEQDPSCSSGVLTYPPIPKNMLFNTQIKYFIANQNHHLIKVMKCLSVTLAEHHSKEQGNTSVSELIAELEQLFDCSFQKLNQLELNTVNENASNVGLHNMGATLLSKVAFYHKREYRVFQDGYAMRRNNYQKWMAFWLNDNRLIKLCLWFANTPMQNTALLRELIELFAGITLCTEDSIVFDDCCANQLIDLLNNDIAFHYHSIAMQQSQQNNAELLPI